MAAPLSEIASVSVTSETAAVTQAGFGIPLILSANAAFAERVRSYSTLTGLSEDFASTTVEYQAATELFAQNPRPEVVYIGRLTNKPTQRWAVTPVAGNALVYKLKIRNAAGSLQEVSFTSDGSGTVTEIIAGLKAAIDLLGLAVTVSDQTTYMRIVADVAGAWFAVESTTSPIENLKVEQDHDTSDISGSLDAIKLENNDWYMVHHLYNSLADVVEIATWVESNDKMFVAQTQETDVISVALGSDSSSVAYSLKNSGRTRTALVYHENNGAFLDCALSGKCLPTTPGSETWMGKQLTLTEGSSNLTSTHLTNLKAKYCGYFVEIGGLNLTFQGKVSSGTYIDVIRLRDWVRSRVQEGIVALVASVSKVPYTDAGINSIADVVRGVLNEGEQNGGIAPGWTVTVPLASAVSDADKLARTLNNVQFDFVLTGAVHSVAVSGTASV